MLSRLTWGFSAGSGVRKGRFSRCQLSTFSYLVDVSVRCTGLLYFLAVFPLHTVGCVPFHMSAVIPVHMQSVSAWCAVCCGADWRDTIQCMGYASFHTYMPGGEGVQGGHPPLPPPPCYILQSPPMAIYFAVCQSHSARLASPYFLKP